ADVRVDQRVPDNGTRVALLLNDGLDDNSRDQLASWVDGGGTLVVADPSSPLAAASFDSTFGPPFRGGCDIAALDDVHALSVGRGAEFAGGPTSETCFGDGHRAFIVSDRRGSGTVVSIGSPELFINDRLDAADDSVLAARLLLPAEGGSVAILDPNPPGS